MRASDLVRADIASMEPYSPVVPLEVTAQRLGRDVHEIVKLNANENPYGPSPAVRQALAQLPFPHLYPDPESNALREALARVTGVDKRLLLAGAGADELIDLLMRLFLQPDQAIIDLPPTFGMYRFDAALVGAQVVNVPRKPDFSPDLEQIKRAAESSQARLLFVASPNNPDGSWLGDQALESLLSLPLVVVLDEAYVEFAGVERSRIGWVSARQNLIVLRTFSKWAGLAGLRVGYGAFPDCIIDDLWKIKQPYGVSQAASAAAIAALDDLPWAQEKVQAIVQERSRLLGLLEQLPWLRPYPSEANFVLCRVLDRDAQQLCMVLYEQGILLRHYRSAGLADHVRISVGQPADTDTLIQALRRC